MSEHDVLDGWERGEFTSAGITHDTYRKGTGPGVVVIHEIPGITPKVAQFADEVVARGFTVVMPDLMGTPGKAPEHALHRREHGQAVRRPRVHGVRAQHRPRR